MKLFECLDGSLINPLLVTSVKKLNSEGFWYIGYKFAGSESYLLECECGREVVADAEIERFRHHFESME